MGVFAAGTAVVALRKTIRLQDDDHAVGTHIPHDPYVAVVKRPPMMSYLPLYNEKQAHRDDVRPDMAGLVQINGRNGSSWKDRRELDVECVNGIPLLSDAVIFSKAFGVLASQGGINSLNSVTMEAFTGAPPHTASKTGSSSEDQQG